jgi:hypothetical protein
MAEAATVPAGALRRRTPSAKDTSERGAYWQHVVLTRITLVRNDLQRARATAPEREEGWEAAAQLLDAATLAAQRPGSRIRLWLNGSAVNRAFVNLHAAQVMLAKHAPDARLDTLLLSAMTRVRTTMPAVAERREDLERRYTEATAPEARDGATLKRWVLEKALEWSYATTDAQYARLRNFRNILSGVSIAVLFFAVGLAALGGLWPDALQLCFGDGAGRVCPTGGAPTARDALVLEILGAAGGALVAVLGVSKMQGTSTPYSVPLALALLKLPFGALTAILGIVLIQGRFVPGLTNLDTSGQILAYAVALGVAQHAVTALVDRRGQELLAGIPGKRSANRTLPGDTRTPAAARPPV